MIEMLFRYGQEYIIIRIRDSLITFSNARTPNVISTIEGLRISRAGVIKEFPDLENNPEWRSEAIKRFKETVREIKGERARAKYIENELKPHGYILKRLRQNGFREEHH